MPDLESRGWEYLESRFGIKRSKLENYTLRKRSGDLWLVSKDLETGLNIEVHGIRFIRDTNLGLKPTTYGLQFLGDRIKKNTVKMDRGETLKMLRREEMIHRDLESDADYSCGEASCSSNPDECCEGYVALEFEGKVIGCGFYRDEKVSSRIPVERSNQLENII